MTVEKIVVIGYVDVPNKNGHIYPREVMEKAIAKFNEKQHLGQIGMPTRLEYGVDLFEASHVVSELTIDDAGNVKAKIVTLGTKRGEMLADLMSVGIDFRTAGYGAIREDENGDKVFNDFVLVSVNAVIDGA